MLAVTALLQNHGSQALGEGGRGDRAGTGRSEKEQVPLPIRELQRCSPESDREGRCICFPPGVRHPLVPQGQYIYSGSISRSCLSAIPPLIFNATCFHILLLRPCPFRADGFSSPFPLCLAAFFFLSFLDSHFFVQKAPEKGKRGEMMHVASH